jgi:ectoine hydroxylase-related dioxygenase (phytanoyl-CoA dioxygenase family)
VREDIQPFFFYGKAGDVMLTHRHLAHSGSQNFSPQIRQALFYDFIRQDIYDRFPATDMKGEEWSEDGRSDRRAPDVHDGLPPSDMWRDWPGLAHLREGQPRL